MTRQILVTEENLCLVCQRRSPVGGLVCNLCRQRLDTELRDLGELTKLLSVVPAERPVSHGEHVSGTREPPVPVNLTAIDLMAHGRTGTVLDEYGDQVGTVSISSVLASWVDDWSTTLKISTFPMTSASVNELVSWLRMLLPTAADRHPAIGDFAREVRVLVYLAKNLLALETRKTRFLKPCPGCQVTALTRGSGDDYAECQSCKRLWTMEELERPVDFIALARREWCPSE